MSNDVFFTTNPSEFTKLEGLYINEKNPPGFIRGADLSVLGIGGVTVRGPSTPQTITSTQRFLDIYGGRDYGTAGGVLINEVWRSMLNKALGTIVVRRVVAADAIVGSKNLLATATPIVRADATSAGAWAAAANNGPTIAIEAASNANALHFNARVSYLGKETVYQNLNVQAGFDNLDEVVGLDVANPIRLVKLADGRPDTAAASALNTVVGTNGTLVGADYNAALTDLAVTQGPSIVVMAGASISQSTLNGTIQTQAALVADRIFLTWSGIHGQVPATEITSKSTHITTPSDRIVWCYNSPYTIDPETGLEIQVPPHEWMMSILNQNDVDIHPGAAQTTAQTAGIRRLTSEVLTRADLILLRNAGICTLEKLPSGIQFRSGITTTLEAGKTEITRRRSTDFLQLSASDRLRYFVKAKNTVEVRAQMGGELVAFSQSLKDAGRIVEDFAVDQLSVNSDSQRAQGVEKILWRVRLIGHILHLVLETEIGTGVVIEA